MTPNEITHQISKLSDELNCRKEDLALLERLSAAKGEVARIIKELSALNGKLEDAIALEDKQRKETFASRVRNLSIKLVTESHRPGSVVGGQFHITFELFAYDSNAHGNIWQDRFALGFNQLEPDMLRLIFEDMPDKLPAEFLALAPGDPYAALERYGLGNRRGYL